MLVLSRKKNEKLQLGDSIQVTVIKVSGDKVRLGIEAPTDTLVLRKELAKIQDTCSQSGPARNSRFEVDVPIDGSGST